MVTDVKWGLGLGEGHRNALWQDSALEGVLGGGWDALEYGSSVWLFASPFDSARIVFSNGDGSLLWFLFIGFFTTSWSVAGGALSTDWRLAARCKDNRSGFFGGAGRDFDSWEPHATDTSEFSDVRDWESWNEGREMLKREGEIFISLKSRNERQKEGEKSRITNNTCNR